MKGSRMCVIEMITPVRLNNSSSGWPMTDSDNSALLTSPSRCSSTIQAATRTRMEVQNGTSTRIISTLAWRSDRVDNQ
jgi:hypothetical protein